MKQICTFDRGGKVLELGNKRVVKFVARPIGKEKQADEDADGEAHADGGETLAGYLQYLLGTQPGNHDQIECQDEYHDSIIVLLLYSRY